jgi:hypothetical protein
MRLELLSKFAGDDQGAGELACCTPSRTTPLLF